MVDMRRAGVTWPEMLVICLIITVAGMIISSAAIRSVQMRAPETAAAPIPAPAATAPVVETAAPRPSAPQVPRERGPDRAVPIAPPLPEKEPADKGDLGLQTAIRTDLQQMVKMLIDGGANVNQADDDGLTPLGLAARLGRLECAWLLLEARADLSGGTKAGHAPIIEATANGHLYVATMLLDAKADTSVRTGQGLSLLHLAAEKGSMPLIKLFVRRGLNVNDAIPETYKLYKYRTPLDFALGSGDLAAVALLVDSGAVKGQVRK